MTPEKIKEVLEKHRLWLSDNNDGERADLSWADLSEAYLSGSDLSEADLRWADLRGAYLRGAYLRGADLRGSNLSEADLRWADLRGSNLRGSNLREAYLRGAYLSGSNLRGAYLSGSNLQSVTGLIWCECSWSAHGENGRRLIAVRIGDDDVYFCGCFKGSKSDLHEYIRKGDAELRRSRMIAADFCSARMIEMRDR